MQSCTGNCYLAECRVTLKCWLYHIGNRFCERSHKKYSEPQEQRHPLHSETRYILSHLRFYLLSLVILVSMPRNHPTSPTDRTWYLFMRFFRAIDLVWFFWNPTSSPVLRPAIAPSFIVRATAIGVRVEPSISQFNRKCCLVLYDQPFLSQPRSMGLYALSEGSN